MKKGGNLKWTTDAEISGDRLLAKFGRNLVANAHVYLSMTPPELVEEESDRRAKRRCLPSGRDGDGRKILFQDTLKPKVKKRWQNWFEEAAQSGYEERTR